MVDIVFWTGPVSYSQVPGATIPGATIVEYGCLGDRPPLCPNKGDQMRHDVNSLLNMAKVSRHEVGNLAMGAFSAGGSLLKRLLLNPEYRDMTTILVLADATYTSEWENERERRPPVMYGFIDYALDVLRSGGSKLFIGSASINPNKNWASGIENLRRLRQEVEARTGRQFVRIPHFFGVTSPADRVPEYVWKLDNLIFAEFSGASDFGHSHPRIQTKVWSLIVNPWLASGKGIIRDDHDVVTISMIQPRSISAYAAFLLAGILGLSATKLLFHLKKGKNELHTESLLGR